MHIKMIKAHKQDRKGIGGGFVLLANDCLQLERGPLLRGGWGLYFVKKV